MSLAAGTRIGTYEVLAPIGAGGMGEVYRARDPKLGRDVALKILPQNVAHDPERRARFQREAHVLASLNHPNIATIHGVEESGAMTALVLELVPGPTLADRIARGPLATEEALPVARQIADALEAAHEQGVIHRDLKPANVKVRDDGTVKVLDFGLAKALDPAQGSGLTTGDVTNSPTITSPAMTAMGMILGTAAYMSPEQARGKPVDKRADIWAFGCLLYEMLSGKRAFEGEDISLTLSQVLQRDPDWAVLPNNVPMRIRHLIERCLVKDPKRRMRDIGEARLGLDESSLPRGGDSVAAVRPLQLWQRPAVATAAALALVAATAAAVWFTTGAPSERTAAESAIEAKHLNIVLPDDAPLVFIGEAPTGAGLTALALSRDGQRLAYVGRVGNTTRLYLRDMNNPTVRPVAGTEGAYAPFFSPDGQWIAFFAGQRLMRATVDGQQVAPIAEANWSYGGSWQDDGRIAVVTNDGARLAILPTLTGELRPIDWLRSQQRMASPSWIPGTDWVLLSCWPSLHICAVSARTGEQRHLRVNSMPAATFDGVALLRGSHPVYIAPGFLAYSAPADNAVMAVRIDATTLQVIGEPVTVLSGVRRENLTGALQFAAAAGGQVAFARGTNAVIGRFVWADRSGSRPVHPSISARQYGNFSLSDDGRRVAAKAYRDTGPPEIWFLDLATGVERRWVDEGIVAGREPFPGAWIPGTSKIIATVVGAMTDVLEIDSERASGAKKLWSGTTRMVVDSIARDGRLVVGNQSILSMSSLDELPGLPADLTALKAIVKSTGQQGLSSLSPDSRWLTYTSDESGPYEVWATRLPPDRPPIRISTGGGELPKWSSRNDGFYYRFGQRWYWVARTGNDDPAFRAPQFYFEGDYLNVIGSEHAVHPDGTRLLLLQGTGDRTTDTLDVITDWRAELERRLSGAPK